MRNMLAELGSIEGAGDELEDRNRGGLCGETYGMIDAIDASSWRQYTTWPLLPSASN